MSSVLVFLSILKLSTAGLYENCVECYEGICCSDPITKIDTLTCKHWTSSSGSFGAPLDVCFGAFGGAEVSSTSQIYKCSDDGSTVNRYDYSGCSDCSCTPNLSAGFNAIFNPQLYGDRDTFNCSGPPCPYYIIEDGVAHPTKECPFDIGKGGVAGGNYATWHVKLILEGCQSFGDTSTLLMCDSKTGVLQMNFANNKCDFDPNNNGGNTDNKTLDGGVVECGLKFDGTGRSVYCSNDDITTTGSATTTTLSATTKAATTTSSVTTTKAATTTKAVTTTASATTTKAATTTGSSGTTKTATTKAATTTNAATTGSATTTKTVTTTDSATTTKAATTTDAGTTKAATTVSATNKADTTKSDTTSVIAGETTKVNPKESDNGYQYGITGFYILFIFAFIILLN